MIDLTVKSADFARELGLAAGVIGRRTSIPILSSARLEADGSGDLTLVATDTEIALRTSCPAIISSPGEPLQIPLHRLHEIAKSLPEADIRIHGEGKGAMRVTAAGFSARLQGFMPDDFPTVPMAEGVSITVPSATLRELIRLTSFCVTEDDRRYYLGGALLETGGNRLRMVATDGHRLALAEAGRQQAEEEFSVLVPRKTLRELAAVLDAGSEETTTITRGPNHLFFESGPRQLISRMVDGTFPAFRRVIPAQYEHRIALDRDRLAGPVTRMTYIQGERSNSVKLDFSSGQLLVSATHAEHGSGEEPMPVEFDGETFAITFNARYVLDMLAVLAPGDLAVELTDGEHAAVFKAAIASVEYLHVIMPVHD